MVVAAFTDNTESTVYRGALWNYEDGDRRRVGEEKENELDDDDDDNNKDGSRPTSAD